MADFKQFRNTTDELDIWLGKLYRVILELQKQSLKAKGLKLNEYTVVPLSSLIHSTNELRKLIEDQKEDLNILKKSPPNMISSMIDFLYNAMVDPKAPTQKEEYQNKLRKLDEKINKDKEHVSVGSALGLRDVAIENKIHNQIESSMQQWTQGDLLKPDFKAGSFQANKLEEQIALKTKYVVDMMLSDSPADLKEEISKLIQVFAKGFNDSNLAGQQFNNFLGSLKEDLKEIVSRTHQSTLEAGFNNIFKTLANMQSPNQNSQQKQQSSKSRKIYAQNTSTLNLFKQYFQKLNPYFKSIEDQEFTKKIDQLLGQLSEKADKKDIDLAHKYYQYVRELFSPQNRNSITFLLKTTREGLEGVINALEQKSVNTEPTQKPEQLTQQQPQIEEPTKTDPSTHEDNPNIPRSDTT